MASKGSSNSKGKASKSNMPKSKHKQRGDASSSSSAGSKDARFSSISEDPRFRTMPSSKKKVQVDDRFKAMFEDSQFTSTAKKDKYGRSSSHGLGHADVSSLYELQQEPTGLQAAALKAEDDQVMKKLKSKDLRDAMVEWDEQSSSSEDEGNGVADVTEGWAEAKIGQGQEEDQEEDVHPVLAAPEMTISDGDETCRLAVMHLDWDHIKAVDIFAMLQSFVPSSGRVKNVTVYPSEFGKERMDKERTQGPALGRNMMESGTKIESEGGSLEEKEYDEEALRTYELDKLRYYYAVATFDSVKSAMTVYEQCDGMEFEASGCVLDLRFIPDDVSFEGDEPREEAQGVPDSYMVPKFTSGALSQSRVELTWDRDDPKRAILKKQAKKGGEIDYAAFVASSDEGESEDEGTKETQRQKYLSLLQPSDEDSDNDGKPKEDIQVTFSSGLGDAAKRAMLKAAGQEETVWEAEQRKQKEKKKLRKADRKQKNSEDANEKSEDQLFDDDDIEWDRNDPFFAEAMKEMSGAESSENMRQKKKADGKKKGKSQGDKSGREANAHGASASELELLVMGSEGKKNKAAFDLKAGDLGRATQRAVELGSRKSKKHVEKHAGDGFNVDVNDERFSAVMTDSKFAIDPLNPNFQKTPGLQKFLEEGRKKRSKKRRREENEERLTDVQRMVKNLKSKQASK